MFKCFFMNRKWLNWSILGTAVIVGLIYGQVYLTEQLNNWYGEFYDMVQKTLAKPHGTTAAEFIFGILGYAKICAIYVAVWVVTSFTTRHYVFRWRTAMNEYYSSHWGKLRHIEGASQRLQEDTMRFASTIEYLGENFINSILTLLVFLPLLWELSKPITELPLIGEVKHSLVYLAVVLAILGTVGLALVGIKLPGLEFDNQRVEAAYRKELVLGEDDGSRAEQMTLKELFGSLRKAYFRYYWHYLYFDVCRQVYLKFSTIVSYIALGPSILVGALTLGMIRQIINAFDQVLYAFQYLVQSWTYIVELISIYKRLKAFEKNIYIENDAAGDQA